MFTTWFDVYANAVKAAIDSTLAFQRSLVEKIDEVKTPDFLKGWEKEKASK